MKKYFRALRAKELLEVFSEYLEEAKRNIYKIWQNSDIEEWPKLKAKLEVLQEIEQTLINDAENVKYYEEELKTLEEEV